MNKLRKLDYGIIITILLAFSAFAVSWGEQKEKMNNIEQSQKNIMDFQEKLFTFTMDLWKIDPKTKKKWSKLPWKPKVKKIKDTVMFIPWYEIEALKYIIKYEVRMDLNDRFLWADTIYKHEEDT